MQTYMEEKMCSDKFREEMLNFNPIEEVENMIKNKINFVGVPTNVNFDYVNIMVNDSYKKKVKGIPQNCFLVCVKPSEEKEVNEFILLRVLEPINLPSEESILASKVEYFKEFMPTGETDLAEKLDPFTKFEFQYSGLKCRVLGTFYTAINQDGEKVLKFGADVENFYSSHNYLVYKPTRKLITYIVNFSNEGSVGGRGSSKIGVLRYSATRTTDWIEEVPVYINTKDLLKNRTALFGMTRTGKSNTVKKIIDCTVQLAKQENRKIGQLIFDINGEYANKNRQDEGTAIAEKYKEDVLLYSIIDKTAEGFLPMRANFYKNIEFAFNMMMPFIEEENADYVRNFKAIDIIEPDRQDFSKYKRYQRKIAALKCCLKKAGFEADDNMKLIFEVNADILNEVNAITGMSGFQPNLGVTLDQAIIFLETFWKKYNDLKSLNEYRKRNEKDWADDDLKAILKVLTCCKEGTTNETISGYKKLKRPELLNLHTKLSSSLFEDDIINALRQGKIVIVDLSEGEEITRRAYSEKIVTRIFNDSMKMFINNLEERDGFNVIQLYFEEAHNLFPKKENSDLSDIYNRLAKEGAKFNLGINYATQEVSSISSNILKNTQNWFIAHLNNTDEIKEINKFYDFRDFEQGILRIKEKGFLRIKTYSNDYVIPVQIDKFMAED